MDAPTATPYFQEVIETVEKLPHDDQWLLVEIIRQRLIQQRREKMVAEVAEAHQAYNSGDVRRGTVADLWKELDITREPSSGTLGTGAGLKGADDGFQNN